MMEFVEGVKAKETLGIAQILEGSYEGKKIRMNGAVHNVRDMGEVAFVIDVYKRQHLFYVFLFNGPQFFLF